MIVCVGGGTKFILGGLSIILQILTTPINPIHPLWTEILGGAFSPQSAMGSATYDVGQWDK